MAFSLRQASSRIGPALLSPPCSRSLSSTPSLLSQTGKTPIVYPSSATLSSDLATSHLLVTGPLGSQRVFIHPFVRLFHSPPADPSSAASEGTLEVRVHDQTQKFERMM